MIGEALQRTGKSDAHPSDYLNFYAIANRQKSAAPDLKHNKGAEKAGAKPDKSFIHVHAKVGACVLNSHIGRLGTETKPFAEAKLLLQSSAPGCR